MEKTEMTFEKVMESMKDMPEEEMMAKMEANKKICKEYCGNCPSYKDTGETELMFCSTGKSEIIKDEKGCLCGGCPVQKNMCLRWQYYCTRGSGKEQLGM